MMRSKLLAAFLAVGVAVTGAAMADGVTAQAVLKLVNGYMDITRAANQTFTVSSSPASVASGTQTIETNAAEVVTVGDVTTKGWSWFRNLSSNGNAIAIGAVDANTNFIEVLRLDGGEYNLGPLGTNAIWAQSVGTNAAASCELEKIIVAN